MESLSNKSLRSLVFATLLSLGAEAAQSEETGGNVPGAEESVRKCVVAVVLSVGVKPDDVEIRENPDCDKSEIPPSWEIESRIAFEMAARTEHPNRFLVGMPPASN